jgi:MFS family permease
LKAISIKRLRQIPLWQPLSARDFRLLWVGQSISILGDQFYLVALPWLVLVLTGSSFALGSVLLVAGATRALFQLIGGALSDRFSPRTLMIISNATGALVTALTAVVVFVEAARPWHLYILGAIFGLIDAMFYPAYMSATPMLLIKEQLVPGNALLRSTVRLMGIIGPAIAGFVVTKIGYSSAFAVDSATFVFATFMLLGMKLNSRHDAAGERNEAPVAHAPPKQGLLASIAEGVRYTWGSSLLRMLFIFLGFFEFAVGGSTRVGLPALAKQQYGPEDGPRMYGWMASSLAAGLLVGMVLSGSFDTSKARNKLLTGLTLVMGASLIALGFTARLVAVCALLFVVGVGGGVLSIVLQAWIQMSTEKRMLGRVMSLLMLGVLFMEMGSFAFAGAVADLDLPLVFIVSGAMMLTSGMIAFASRTIRMSN